MAGRSSGKRTLAELLDHDLAAKRTRREERGLRDVSPQRVQHKTSSKYFACASSSTAESERVVSPPRMSNEAMPTAGPSRLDRHRYNKENVPCRLDNAIEQPSEEDCGEISLDEEESDPVTQEDGYLSPSPSICGWDSPEVSSPVRPGSRMSRLNQAFSDDEFGADVLSSPTAPGRHQVKRLVARNSRSRTPTRPSPSGKVLVHGTPTPSKKKKKARAVHRSYGTGPDLRDIFEDWDDLTSEIDEWCEDSMESTQSSGGGPVTPDSCTQARADICMDDLSDEVILDDDEEIHEREAAAAREAKVASGWWERWAYKGAVGAGQRRSVCVGLFTLRVTRN